jgi:hypothetical protein
MRKGRPPRISLRRTLAGMRGLSMHEPAEICRLTILHPYCFSDTSAAFAFALTAS